MIWIRRESSHDYKARVGVIKIEYLGINECNKYDSSNNLKKGDK